MKLTVTFRDPEPGQLADGECFAQPFYRLWGGDEQPLVVGIFDGVGQDAATAYDDAVLAIERELAGAAFPDACGPLLERAYALAMRDETPLPAGGPYVCSLCFSLP